VNNIPESKNDNQRDMDLDEIFNSLYGTDIPGEVPIGWFLNYKNDYADDSNILELGLKGKNLDYKSLEPKKDDIRLKNKITSKIFDNYCEVEQELNR